MAFLIYVVLLCLVIAITTHTITTFRAKEIHHVKDRNGEDIGAAPPASPYWIPFLGHLLPVLWSPEGCIANASHNCLTDVIALKILGRTFNVVLSKQMIASLMFQRKDTKSHSPLSIRILRQVFGLPARDIPHYLSVLPTLDATVVQEVRDPQKLSEIQNALVAQLQQQLPDLLTFNSSPVDQEAWERAAQPELADDRETVEIDLFALTCTFLNHLTIDGVLSPSLLSQEPETAKQFADFSKHVSPLLSGLSRTIPWPALPRAHIARRQLITKTTAFMRAVTLAVEEGDPGPEYRDLMDGMEGLRPILAARQAVFTSDAGRSLSAAAISADFSYLAWSLCAPNALCSWTLLHLAASQSDLLKRVCEEVEMAVDVKQPEGIFGFAVAPNVKINLNKILRECPLLHSCWLETIRLYGRGVDVLYPNAQTALSGPSAHAFTAGEQRTWVLGKQEPIVLPSWGCNLNPNSWRQPQEWQGDRHLRELQQTNDENIGPIDGDVLCQMGSFGADAAWPITEGLCLSFIASFIMLWSIEPAKPRLGVFVPGASFAPAVAFPRKTVRVSIRKRELPIQKHPASE